MQLDSLIVLGSKSANEKGDLFASSMSALFSILGYQDFRFNIHKTGREVDIEANHSTESRRLIAECKATAEPVGGKDINAFMGKVDVEKRKDNTAVQPYFVSLTGFTQSAIEQEKEAGSRVVLLDGPRVIDHLVRGSILIDKAIAAERSGRLTECESPLQLYPRCNLVVSVFGNVWLFFYTENNTKVCFSFIHGDGTFISSKLSAELTRDPALTALTRGLRYLAPKTQPDEATAVAAVKRKYMAYLAKVCGEIPLDGLPADQEVGAKRLKLENLFVPLKLMPLRGEESTLQSETATTGEQTPRAKRSRKHEVPSAIPVGRVLEHARRLAILGLPGSGKSTLLKRLAIAYAFPARKAQVDDNLPECRWLPIFLRCRQLGNRVREPLLGILNDIRSRAEIDDSQSGAFEWMMLDVVKSGKGLLLVDGLDEISSDSDRVAFVNQLRLFLAQYPAISLVVTSRIAGFRVIGNALSSDCEHYTLAPFESHEITTLTVAWHTVVIGSRKEVAEGANRVAATICANSRLMKLAENPLLLTTLLLIKRWVTQLPTKRSALYGRAVEVLLMTWNVEGHQPLDPDEVIPQLAYVALQMMKNGVQRIAVGDLQRELYEARRSMPEILAHAKMGVPEFIETVELRSSLLLLSGHELRNGTIQPIYEFRHLLFQEYLAAKAVVESYLPGGVRDTISNILLPHLQDNSWEEVIVLSASLGGRNSADLIKQLTNAAREDLVDEPSIASEAPHQLLAQCLADEVPLANPDLNDALTELIPARTIQELYTSRYGREFRSICARELWSPSRFRLMSSGGHIGEFDYRQIAGESTSLDERVERVLNKLTAKYREAVEGLFCCAIAAYAQMGPTSFPPNYANQELSSNEAIRKKMVEMGNIAVAQLKGDTMQAQVASAWCLAWLGNRQFWTADQNLDVISRLFALWATTPNSDIQYLSAWAVVSLPVGASKLWPILKGIGKDSLIRDKVKSTLSGTNVTQFGREVPAALLYKLYVGELEAEKQRYMELLKSVHSPDYNAIPLLAEHLGVRMEELNSQSRTGNRRVASERPSRSLVNRQQRSQKP